MKTTRSFILLNHYGTVATNVASVSYFFYFCSKKVKLILQCLGQHTGFDGVDGYGV